MIRLQTTKEGFQKYVELGGKYGFEEVGYLTQCIDSYITDAVHHKFVGDDLCEFDSLARLFEFNRELVKRNNSKVLGYLSTKYQNLTSAQLIPFLDFI